MTVASDPSRWGVTSLQLQRPEHVYFDGAVRPWGEATFHVSTEAVIRGLNVFEGLKGYWQQDGTFAWRTLRPHYERMTRSAQLLHIPTRSTTRSSSRPASPSPAPSCARTSDLYIRATLFVVEGHYGEGTVSDLVLTAYKQEKAPPHAIDVGHEHLAPGPGPLAAGADQDERELHDRPARPHRGQEPGLRGHDPAQPVRTRCGGHRRLRADGARRAPLQPAGVGGRAREHHARPHRRAGEGGGHRIERRPIDRSELYIADELGLTGTLAEITEVRSIDDQQLPAERPVLALLAERYREAVTGVRPHPAVELDVFPG